MERRPAHKLPSCSSMSSVAENWIALRAAGEPTLCQAASERLWKAFLAPVVFYPLAAGDMLAGGPEGPATEGVRRMSVGNWARTWLPPGAPPAFSLVLFCLVFVFEKAWCQQKLTPSSAVPTGFTSGRPFQTPAAPAQPAEHPHTLQSVSPGAAMSMSSMVEKDLQCRRVYQAC